ncbi:hypothetical protein CN481_15605 [Bacillus sp. AFS006103]|nr:hypothetical protein CN481_15605 [Bacillus sp. AFS006103]
MRANLDILRKNDPVLGKLIDLIGELELYKQDNHYLSLVKSIIGQQLSIKAAEAIFIRFIDLTERSIIPEKVIMLSDEAHRKIGISYQKIKYI